MPPSPTGVADFRFRNFLLILAGRKDRDRQPVQAVRSFDLVSVAPVMAIESDFVVQQEMVRFRDDVEIPLPGNVVGLEDGDRLCAQN